jgi:HK97 family phage major capsid protein|nr:MAG TPA: major capsid protein [Caudoviricetes sp.]
MKNLVIDQEQKTGILQRMSTAIQSNDTESFSQAWTDLAETIQSAVLEESKEIIASNDTAVLAQRGVRQLTNEENKYYSKVIEAMRGKDPKQAITLIDDVMPKTVIDEVFKYLTESHPLLDAITFQNTGAIVQWIMSTSSGVAGWGELCSTIDDELSGAFSVIELGKYKLSAFIPVCQAMLDLGPVWLDSYVRTLLSEALAVALEAAIVDGDGNGKPIGMTRALTGAVDGVYPQKTAVAITALDTTTYGTLLNTLSQAPNNKRRAISSVLLVVNPADYFTKVFPATTPRTTDGGFSYGVFPFPTTVVQSSAVPSGKAVMGLADRYFMGLGTGTAKGGKIEYSDEYKFLEDQRVYKIKLYGNGRPMDENAFILLDITGLVPYVQQVFVANAAEFPGGTTPEG